MQNDLVCECATEKGSLAGGHAEKVRDWFKKQLEAGGEQATREEIPPAIALMINVIEMVFDYFVSQEHRGQDEQKGLMNI